jgi:superkiller protein 3
MKHYLRENPDDAYILGKLGGVCCSLGRHAEAEGYLKRAVEIDPDCPLTNYSLGLLLLEKKELEAAIKHFEEASKENSSLAEAQACLGAIYVEKGVLDRAVSHLNNALSINSELALAHGHLGTAYHMMGRLDEAIVQYKRVMEIDRDNPDAHVSLGAAYREKGFITEAIAEYQRALAVDSKIAGKVHNNLAVLYYSEKQHKKAVYHCSEAVKLGFEVHPKLVEDLERYR